MSNFEISSVVSSLIQQPREQGIQTNKGTFMSRPVRWLRGEGQQLQTATKAARVALALLLSTILISTIVGAVFVGVGAYEWTNQTLAVRNAAKRSPEINESEAGKVNASKDRHEEVKRREKASEEIEDKREDVKPHEKASDKIIEMDEPEDETDKSSGEEESTGEPVVREQGAGKWKRFAFDAKDMVRTKTGEIWSQLNWENYESAKKFASQKGSETAAYVSEKGSHALAYTAEKGSEALAYSKVKGSEGLEFAAAKGSDAVAYAKENKVKTGVTGLLWAGVVGYYVYQMYASPESALETAANIAQNATLMAVTGKVAGYMVKSWDHLTNSSAKPLNGTAAELNTCPNPGYLAAAEQCMPKTTPEIGSIHCTPEGECHILDVKANNLITDTEVPLNPAQGGSGVWGTLTSFLVGTATTVGVVALSRFGIGAPPLARHN